MVDKKKQEEAQKKVPTEAKNTELAPLRSDQMSSVEFQIEAQKRNEYEKLRQQFEADHKKK